MEDRKKRLEALKQIERLVISEPKTHVPAFDYQTLGLTSEQVKDLEEVRLQLLKKIEKIISDVGK